MSNKSAPNMAKPSVTVAPKQSPPKDNKTKENGKMHRRSRSGCFTCRLRRKKCDEGQGQCKACRHLGLTCEYKRPHWWSNADQRRAMKESIKAVIKRTKSNEKVANKASAAQQAHHLGGDTPPELSHSLPTSATYSVTPRTGLQSAGGSPFSSYHDFNQTPQIHDTYDTYNQPHILSPPYESSAYYPLFPATPYEVDIKTERQMFVDDIPTRKDSSTSTFSTFQPPATVNPFSEEEWMPEGVFENTEIFSSEADPDYAFFPSAPQQPLASSHSVHVDVEEYDRPLLDHFVENVLRLILPVYEIYRPGAARSSVVLPALASNKCYLHCCLVMAATHLKSTQRNQDEQLDADIMRHRLECVQALCAALNVDHHQVLDATLGMMLFPCAVGDAESDLPDIPWHAHFKAATDLVRRLQLQHTMEQVDGGQPQPPFNMSLTSWIDILGATMIGRSPVFADTYREKNEANLSSGLLEIMGCEDKVMYMISEVACLDALKAQGAIDDLQVCELVKSLGMHLDATETRVPMEHAVTTAGAIRPKHLALNLTAVFRLAARIYLCSLVPDASRHKETSKVLVDRLATVLEFVPSGPDGFDRSLAWPLLVGGSMSTPDSRLRRVLDERVALLGDQSELGSFGRAMRLLREVWRQADEAEHAGETRNVHWRDVMTQKGWDFLLI